MFKARISFFTLITLQALAISPASATDCISIKQDKPRLKCYDEREKISIEQAQASAAAAQTLKSQQLAEFKKLAATFVRDAQTNLTIASLQWQNFMDSPKSKPVAEVLENNKKIQDNVANLFSKVMSAPGKEDPISEKLKDYFVAWRLAFTTIRPTSSDSNRAFSARSNSELLKMEAQTERLLLDLQPGS